MNTFYFFVATFSVLFFGFTTVQAQEQKIYELRLVEPGAFVYEDLGSDEEGQIDLYEDGHPQFSLQLIGLNFLSKGEVRFGLGFGAGLSKPSTNDENTDGILGILTGGLVLQFLEGSINIEAGYILGHSFKETLNKSQKNDKALYFGISFPTKLGDAITGSNDDGF